MKENYKLEFKQEKTDTFLKTVSAYANYGDGEILFGVSNDGSVAELKDIDDMRMWIENKINGKMEPVPEFQIAVKKIDGKEIIALSVFRGPDTPYYYKDKKIVAYKRSDTSSVPVSRLELNRLILQRQNLNYEDRPSSDQNLSFGILEKKMAEIMGVKELSEDVFRTLKLKDKKGRYNYAAGLLADQNTIEYCGIDLTVFGKDINQILHREQIVGISLLSQFDRAYELFEQRYQYEEIQGELRVEIELIPRDAFREALANALVHRRWDINRYIQIAMFPDRLEINSPGGLPDDLTSENYLSGFISSLRNPIVADVFNKLGLIEKFGMGITRIRKTYKREIEEPVFNLSPDNIGVILPVIGYQMDDLSRDETSVYELIQRRKKLSRAEIDQTLSLSKDKSLLIIKTLLEKSLIATEGTGRSTKYIINQKLRIEM